MRVGSVGRQCGQACPLFLTRMVQLGPPSPHDGQACLGVSLGWCGWPTFHPLLPPHRPNFCLTPPAMLCSRPGAGHPRVLLVGARLDAEPVQARVRGAALRVRCHLGRACWLFARRCRLAGCALTGQRRSLPAVLALCWHCAQSMHCRSCLPNPHRLLGSMLPFPPSFSTWSTTRGWRC